MSKSRKSFPLRLNPDLYEDIRAWAEQEMRSVNGQIEFILKQAVTARRKSNRDRTQPDADEETERL